MKRRTFLTLTSGLVAWPAIGVALPPRRAVAAIDRLSKWRPSDRQTLAIEWRYIAGRIINDSQDYGFIVALSDVRFPTATQELLVQRQDLKGGQAFAAQTYIGTLTYNDASATYTFQAGQASASWQLDQATQLYHLSVTTPELNLQNIVLRPQGDLIAEGGDGEISIGQALGFEVGSDYHADWAHIEIGGQPRGIARVDMQGLYAILGTAASPAQSGTDYDHRWFAVAGQAGGEPVWISAWRIEATGGPLWAVTIARSDTSWAVESTTEQSTVAQALEVRELAWQPLPATAGLGAQRAGSTWRIRAGVAQPGDLIDLEIVVPPGQFASSARLGALGILSWMEEAVGVQASGTVQGQPLSNVTLAVAESTAEFSVNYAPLVRR
jgi:hypothetical protein